MLDFVIAFLGLSLLLYVLLGGADFGAGVVEIIAGSRRAKTISHAIGPIWEANHIWLIIAVVILFTGFPAVYALVTTYLHIPLLALLIGIVMRGTAFAFRSYDAYRDSSQRAYNIVFRASSVFVPYFFGVVVAALLAGKLQRYPESFYEAYMAPWLGWFPACTGIFTTSLFAFLAAVYLIGDTDDAEAKRVFKRAAIWINAVAVVSGALVFVAAEASGAPLWAWLWDSALSVAGFALATLSLPIVWVGLAGERVALARCAAGAQVAFVIVGWLALRFPEVARFSDGSALTLFDAAAPEATLTQLGIALAVGSLLILPALGYLMWTFKRSGGESA